MLQPQPLGEQVQHIAGRVGRIEMLGQVVQRGDERIQQRLEPADQAHAEVALVVDPGKVVAQVTTTRDGRRRGIGADGPLDLHRAEPRPDERLKQPRRLAVAVGDRGVVTHDARP
jgi:hypothetical protein